MNDEPARSINIKIEEGFYVDPETKKVFYLKITDEGLVLKPHWVKSKMSDWTKIERAKEDDEDSNDNPRTDR